MSRPPLSPPFGSQAGAPKESNPRYDATTGTIRPYDEPTFASLMGDDGTGHCRGCGGSIETFDTRCDVCMTALDAVAGGGEAA